MLSNFPKNLKYAIGDRPYCMIFNFPYHAWSGNFENGRGRGLITRVKITGWRTEVSDPASDDSGLQENYYTVKRITGYNPEHIDDHNTSFTELYDSVEFELSEDKLFSSPNHLVASKLNKYFNGDSEWFKNWWIDDSDNPTDFGKWVDLAGMDFEGANFLLTGAPESVKLKTTWTGTDPDIEYTGGEVAEQPALIFDGANLTNAVMPAGLDTKSDFRDNVFSYDAETTIWTDGDPIGMP